MGWQVIVDRQGVTIEPSATEADERVSRSDVRIVDG